MYRYQLFTHLFSFRLLTHCTLKQWIKVFKFSFRRGSTYNKSSFNWSSNRSGKEIVSPDINSSTDSSMIQLDEESFIIACILTCVHIYEHVIELNQIRSVSLMNWYARRKPTETTALLDGCMQLPLPEMNTLRCMHVSSRLGKEGTAVTIPTPWCV